MTVSLVEDSPLTEKALAQNNALKETKPKLNFGNTKTSPIME
jgi:hypothetical protein